MTAISFDISMAELLLPLYVGGSLVAGPPGTRLDPAIFARTVRRFEPSVVQATPSFWRLALAWGWRGQDGLRIWCGGETLTPGLVRSLLPCCAQLWNVYGPTEATIWACAAQVTSAAIIDLGSPLPGTGLFLQRPDGEVRTDRGVDGEIVLYGTGLASGYINRPELTAERFCEQETPDGRARCYRTGDLAAYRDDGTLEFLGRADNQIKLRGYRIELGELEAVAEEHPAIWESAAILRDTDHPERTHIAVFVVTDGSVEVADLRRWFAARLPAGMRPAKILLRPALPRTSAGKIDRVELRQEPE